MVSPPNSTVVSSDLRFEFGRNWRRFLSTLNDERIAAAMTALKEMLGVETLSGHSFLDIGSGSGLSSLAAVLLKAERVHSFDYDPESVAVTMELKRLMCPAAEHWTIETGSVLDSEWLLSLGQWDIVYSWGVLHHTGAMWRALENVVPLVRTNGVLFVSIYNEQELWSTWWRGVKRLYNRNVLGRWLSCAIFIPAFVVRGAVKDLLTGRDPMTRYCNYHNGARGMSLFRDWIDWLGGYPFEVAKPERIFEFYAARGFCLERLKTCGGRLGCNEFVFRAAGRPGPLDA